MHQTGSFPPLPPLVSLLCPAPRQGAVREGIWASGPAAAGGPGREGGGSGQPRARLPVRRTGPGAVTGPTRAAAVKCTPGGARAPAPPPRGSRPTPPAGSRRCRDKHRHKGGAAPGAARTQPRHPRGLKVVLYPQPGAPGARTRRNARPSVWRCEGREDACRGGTTKELAAGAGKTAKKKK